MSPSASPGSVVTVTGGCGYVGIRLGRQLLQLGYRVQLFDIACPDNLDQLLGLESMPKSVRQNLTFIKGDIRDPKDVARVMVDTKAKKCVAVDVVNVTGTELVLSACLEAGVCRLVDISTYNVVNVTGTELVLSACLEAGVYRLVYTSTYNVVFCGQTIVNGDESHPYVDLDKFKDVYSVTKAKAEMLVLEADGKSVRSKSKYFLRNADSALILAGEALSDEKKHVAGGQSYFISDNKPINNFEFMRAATVGSDSLSFCATVLQLTISAIRDATISSDPDVTQTPFITGLGYSFPFIRLPYPMMYRVAWGMEAAHDLLAPLGIKFVPLLSRAEVNKCAVTHFFSIKKAQSQLGYQPVDFTISETTDWFMSNGFGRNAPKPSDSGSWKWSAVVAALVLLLALLLISFVMPALKGELGSLEYGA
eukprot:gene5146-34956_t